MNTTSNPGIDSVGVLEKRSLGSVIGRKRRELGISQQRLAALLKKHPSYVSKVEKDQYVPGPQVIRLLATWLHADFDELFRLARAARGGGDVVSPDVIPSMLAGAGMSLSASEQTFLHNFRKLSEEGRKFMEVSLRNALAGEGTRFEHSARAGAQTKNASDAALFRTPPSTEKPVVSEIRATAAVANVSPSNASETSSPRKYPGAELVESARTAFENGQKQHSLDLFEEALDKSKFNEKTLRTVCAFLMGNGENDAALKFLRRAKVQSGDLVFMLGAVLERTGDNEGAVSLYLESAKQDKKLAKDFVIHAAANLAKRDETSKAKELLRDLRPEEVSSWRNLLLCASTALELQEFDTVIRFAEAASRTSKDNGFGLKFLSLALLFTAKKDRFAEVAEQIVAANSEDSWGHFCRALASQDEGDVGKTLVNFERAIALGLDFSPLSIVVADYLLEGEASPSKMVQLLTAMTNGRGPEFVELLARAHFLNGENERAIETAKDGVVKFPNARRLTHTLARALMKSKRIEEAENFLEQDRRRAEAEPNNLYLLARLKWQRGDLEGANVLFKEIIRITPDTLSTNIDYAQLLAEMGHDASAFELLQNLRKKWPTDESVLLAESDLYLNKKLYPEATNTLRELISIAPKARHLHLLGFACVRSMYLSEGIEAFRKACEADPSSCGYANNLGYALNMAGRHEEAIISLQSALNLSPSTHDYSLIYSNLAHAFIKLGRVEKAMESARKSLEFDQGWAEAHYNYGLVLFSIGDQEKAKEEFGRAMSLDEDGACTVAAAKRLGEINQLSQKGS